MVNRTLDELLGELNGSEVADPRQTFLRNLDPIALRPLIETQIKERINEVHGDQLPVNIFEDADPTAEVFNFGEKE